MFSQHHADGVHRIVARQSLRSKSRQGVDHHGLAERDLILDDHMGRRMKRQLRDSDATPAMVGLDKSDSLGFVHCEPRGRGWPLFRIVGLHEARCRFRPANGRAEPRREGILGAVGCMPC